MQMLCCRRHRCRCGRPVVRRVRSVQLAATEQQLQFFTQAFWNKTVAAGEVWTFGGKIDLTDNEGGVLPAGDYTLRIQIDGYPYGATAAVRLN